MGLSFPAELRYADSHEYAGPSDDGNQSRHQRFRC